MDTLTKTDLAAMITDRLTADAALLRRQWENSGPVRHAVIDDLLDPGITRRIRDSFPDPSQLLLRDTIRERKRAGVQVDQYPPLAGAALFAFQQPSVIQAVSQITGQRGVMGDPSLYAAGLSVMAKDDFLGIHIDNSHDGDHKLYRVLNLLFYVTPDWDPADGGNLEVWDEKVQTPTVVPSLFNRLVLMQTDRTSWHSVQKVTVPGPRCCVSNYYFSPAPVSGRPYDHVTTFTARPDERLKRARLYVTDRLILNRVAKAFPGLTKRTKHRRQVEDDD